MASDLVLTRAQFRYALRNGFGRALIHVHNNGIGEFRDEILEACLHVQGVAPDDDHRAQWMTAFISYVSDPAYFRDRILAAADTCTDERDATQLYWLLCYLADDGDTKARALLYRCFDRQHFGDTRFTGPIQLLAMDGMDGLLHIAKIHGERALREPDLDLDDYILDRAGGAFGEEPVKAALEARAAEDERVRAYLDAVTRDRSNDMQSTTERWTLETLLAAIESDTSRSGYCYRKFGHYASAEDLEQVYYRIFDEHRVHQRLCYLQVFAKADVPHLDDRLFELALCDDMQTREAAMNILAREKSQRMHDWVIGIIRERTVPVDRGVIKILENNYQPGDHVVLESCLLPLTDRDQMHDLQLGLLSFLDRHFDARLLNVSLWIYEHGPCSFCRLGFVRRLHEHGALPEWMAFECEWDCKDDTREFIEVVVRQGGTLEEEP